MLVPINLTGGSYSHKSLPISAQVTRNFWPQLIDDPFAKGKYVLESFAGQKLFGTIGSVGRGIFYHNSLLYRVAGTSLYSVNSSGTHVLLGSIPGTERCIFDAIGTDIIVVTERKAYIYNGSSVSEVTDSDLESPDSVTVLNNQAIYDGNEDNFGVSDVGDASSINGLNYASAESRSDNLVRVYAFDQVVYMMGETTTELWWNSGVGQPPFDRVEGGIVEVGLGAIHAVTNTKENLFFFGNDRKVYAVKGSTASAITTEPLVRTFQSYSTVNDAIMWSMNMRDQDFIVLTFPTENKTFVLPIGGQWFEWSSGVEGSRNIANSYTYAYGKHIVEDYSNGNLYELDFDTYTENANAIVRLRDSAPLHGGLFGAPGRTLFMNKLEIILETGVGINGSGQGSDPVIMVSFSDDGGKTFSTETWGSIGKLGEFQWKVELFCLGSFTSRIIRIKTSDPVYYSIVDASVDIEIGI